MSLYKKQKPLTVQRSFRIDVDTFTKLVITADSRGVKYNALVRTIIRDWLAKHGKGQV